MVDPNVGKPAFVDQSCQGRNPVAKRLTADDPDVLVGCGLGREVLARAKADFKPNRAIVA